MGYFQIEMPQDQKIQIFAQLKKMDYVWITGEKRLASPLSIQKKYTPQWLQHKYLCAFLKTTEAEAAWVFYVALFYEYLKRIVLEFS